MPWIGDRSGWVIRPLCLCLRRTWVGMPAAERYIYDGYTAVMMSRDGDLLTTRQVYQSVILKERKGEYLGKTVQVVPHITDEIQVRPTFIYVARFRFTPTCATKTNPRRLPPTRGTTRRLTSVPCHGQHLCAHRSRVEEAPRQRCR